METLAETVVDLDAITHAEVMVMFDPRRGGKKWVGRQNLLPLPLLPRRFSYPPPGAGLNTFRSATRIQDGGGII
jgi:hypothetical protein